jgi:hypothetical protein
MNMISDIRQRVSEYGFTNITIDEFNQLQAEWITRANIEVIPPVVPEDKCRAMLAKKLDLIRCGIGGNYGGNPFENPLYTEVVELLSAAKQTTKGVY